MPEAYSLCCHLGLKTAWLAESSMRTKMKPPIDKSGTSAGSMGGQVGCRSFKSLFQGDHLEVEFALVFLMSHILRHHPFPRGPVWQGIVIDDFFAISLEDARLPSCSAASVDVYAKEKVLGSDDKTVRGAEAFKVVGAEVLSDEQARRCNGTFVSAPAAKRLLMICLALAAARLPCISKSLAARIAGNWVSIFMCRHPLCCILNGIFAFGSKPLADTDDVVPLPRRVAEELALIFHCHMTRASMLLMHPLPKELSPLLTLEVILLVRFGLVVTREVPTQCLTPLCDRCLDEGAGFQI